MSVGARPSTVSPARAAAYRVVRRVFEQGAYADRALYAEAAGLEPRERALATALAYSTIQRRATLDHVLGRLSRRDPGRLDPPVRAALELGLAQLLLLSGVPEHAAVHQGVELVKGAGRGSAAGLVNAVLRRATRDGPEILAGLSDATPEQAAILHSVPEWLARRWFQELGTEEARSLLRAVNLPAESALRVNTLVSSVEAVRAGLPVAARPAGPELPEGLLLEGPFDAHGSPLFERGAIMPQSRGSMLVSRALAPRPRERVLDLCAAPGAKTTHLAALMGGEGSVLAVERHSGRAGALRRTLRRMRAERVEVRVADAAEPLPERGAFDRVLVDPPCSGLGTLQSRPDLRWRASPERIAEVALLQGRILRAAAAATRSGGTLVYSVCTISRAEGPAVVEAFLREHPEFSAEGPATQLRPDRDGTDGFYIARLRRAAV